MNHKRKTLKKVAGVSSVAALAPTSWTKPVLKSVILPAHAQLSENAAPTVNNVSCSFNTAIVKVGTIVTVDATIADADNPLSEVGWRLVNNKVGTLLRGEGQFIPTTYTIAEKDVTDVSLVLEVFDVSGNETNTVLCFEPVINDAPTISNISCSYDTEFINIGTVITLEATISDTDDDIENIYWRLRYNTRPPINGEGQFLPVSFTVTSEDFDLGRILVELEAFNDSSNRTLVTLCNDVIA